MFIYPPTAGAGFVVIAHSLLSHHVLLFADMTTLEPSFSMEGECCHILHIEKSMASVGFKLYMALCCGLYEKSL